MFLHLLKKLSKWLKYNWQDLFFVLLLLSVVSFIALKNYVPNTYLTGWDNLHPEFNFNLNIERSLSVAWQEYQGVGLIGGMSHAADLPRQIILAGVSVFLPINLIRYLWTFLMLFIGPLGVYFLLRKLQKVGALVASSFYLFNLATVQYFFVPFETFVGFYGFLPWLLYFAISYLDNGKGIWKYIMISFLATTAFYVQTLFVVYGIFLVAVSFKNIKRSFKLFLVTFLVNSFWLLPVLWFTFTSGNIPSNSEINRIASPETIYMNQGRINFTDTVNLKGYWFDYYDFNDGKFDYLFKPWIEYGNKPYAKEIAIGLFAVSVIGLVLSKQYIWMVLLCVGYLMLSGVKIPIAVLEEAFRNSFTKWSVAFSFVISIGLGYFIFKFKKFAIIPAVIVIFASVYSISPIFKGELISSRVKINIPSVYFETFDWFNNKTKQERVAYFPAFDKWGWNYHDWGYGGSGLIWYGIKNPILDRAFNVWSPNNENYYNEITKAILDDDKDIYQKTINKYQVKYLFFDGSVIFPWGDKDLLKLEITKNFAEELGYQKVFNKDFIEIYDTGISTENISTLNSYKPINADLTYSKFDPVYEKYGNYIQDDKALTLPFVNFDTRGEVKFEIVDDKLQIINKAKNVKATLQISERVIEDFDKSHGYPETTNCDLMKSGNVIRTIDSFSRTYRAVNGGVACDYFVYDQLKYNASYVMHIKGQNKEGRSLKIYLYNWESKRVELEELLPTGDFDSYYVVYPKKVIVPQSLGEVGGYTLNVETRSFGRIASENIIEKIEFVPFNIEAVQDLQIDSELIDETIQTNNLQISNVKKYGTAIYKVETTGSGVLELGQGYESGWVALQIINNKLQITKLEHVKVNGWANGFIVPTNHSALVTNHYIFFWPQFLEWGGLLLLLCVTCILTFAFIIVKSKKIS